MQLFSAQLDVNCYFTFAIDGYSRDVKQLIGRGESVGSHWEAFSPRVIKNGPGRLGDFMGTSFLYAAISLSDRCLRKLDPSLLQGCELLPFHFESHPFWLLNVPTPNEPLDWTKSAIDEELREVRFIEWRRDLVFDRDRIGNRHVFRLPEGQQYFVSGEFKKAVEDARLTGLKFLPVWTDEPGGFSVEEVSSPAIELEMTDEDRKDLQRTKRGRLLLKLWETVINPCGEVRWVENLVQRERVRTSEQDRILAETAFTMLRKGVSMEEFAKWARGIAYSVVFAVAVALDEEGAYSRASLFGLFREFSPDHWDALKGRRQRVAERLWKDAIVYFESEEWWTAEIQSVDDTNDFPFLTDAGKVMKNSLSLGVTSADWKAAAQAMAIQVTHKTLQVIDELESFSPASLGGLHEDILMANPHGTS